MRSPSHLLLVSLAAVAWSPVSVGEVLLTPYSELVRPIEAGRPLRFALPPDTVASTWVVTLEERGVDLLAEPVTSAETRRGPTPCGPVSSPIDRQGTLFLVLDARKREVIETRTASPEGRGELAILARPFATSVELAAAQAMHQAGCGVAEDTGESRQKALDAYDRALESWHQLGDRRYQAEVLESRGKLWRRLGELPRALAELEQALQHWRDLGTERRQASVLSDIGLTQRDLRRPKAARSALEEALALHRSHGDQREEAVVFNILCMLGHAAGNLREAVDCYREARDLSLMAGDSSNEASALNNLGYAWDSLGEPLEARRAYESALAIRRRLGQQAGVAQVLNNLAVVDRRTGDYAAALKRYLDALTIFSDLGDRRNLASVHNNLATVYNALGEPERARAFLEEALELRRSSGDRRGELTLLSNLGGTLFELGKVDDALNTLRRAQRIAHDIGHRWLEAKTASHLGRMALDAGRPGVARPSFDEAIAALRGLGHRLSEAHANLGRGKALLDLGERVAARADLDRALELFRRLGEPSGEAAALAAFARLERADGDLKTALDLIDSALARQESVRARLAHPRLGATLAGRRAYWELRIELLMDLHVAEPNAGFDRRAFETAETARARALRDVLAEDRGLHAGVDSELTARRIELERRLAAKSNRLLRLADRHQPTAAAQILEGEAHLLETELDRLESEIHRTHPRVRTLSEPPADVASLQQLLDPDTALLTYSLGKPRGFVWRITPNSFASYELPPRTELEGAVRRMLDDLSTLDADQQAEETRNLALARAILGPALAGFEGERLAVVADGALHYVPFGVLLDPSTDASARPQPMVERFEIVYLPSASVLALQRRARSQASRRVKAGPQIAILADPIFGNDDTRLIDRAPTDGERVRDATAFVRLPATRSEALAIAELASEGQALVALGAEANRPWALGPEVASASIIHIATHGLLNAGRPLRSGLVFSMVDTAGRPSDGFLTLRDLYNHRFKAELVVLSACRTALGRQIRGEGLLSLTRAFQYAGAERVVASLWQVSDRATAELMIRFYRALWHQGLAPAAALRHAQLELRAEPHHRDPYFWGAFVLQGDWR